MWNNLTPRNRHFWHSAEFSRLATKADFKVKLGAYEKYQVPAHPNASDKSFTYWPAQLVTDHTKGAHGKFDIFLFPAGNERFTQDVLPKGPWDGFLILIIKIRFDFDTALDYKDLLPQMRAAVLEHNGKYYATGALPKAAGVNWNFNKCYVRFSPRALVKNKLRRPGGGRRHEG